MIVIVGQELAQLRGHTHPFLTSAIPAEQRPHIKIELQAFYRYFQDSFSPTTAALTINAGVHSNRDGCWLLKMVVAFSTSKVSYKTCILQNRDLSSDESCDEEVGFSCCR